MINDILTLSHSINESALHRNVLKSIIPSPAVTKNQQLLTNETVIISKLTKIIKVLVKISKENKDLKQKLERTEVKIDHQDQEKL